MAGNQQEKSYHFHGAQVIESSKKVFRSIKTSQAEKHGEKEEIKLGDHILQKVNEYQGFHCLEIAGQKK